MRTDRSTGLFFCVVQYGGEQEGEREGVDEWTDARTDRRMAYTNMKILILNRS